MSCKVKVSDGFEFDFYTTSQTQKQAGLLKSMKPGAKWLYHKDLVKCLTAISSAICSATRQRITARDITTQSHIHDVELS